MNADLKSLVRKIRRSHVDAETAYALLRLAGANQLSTLRALRAAFDLDLASAKEIMVRASDVAPSLDKHQETLLEGLKKAFQTMEPSNGHPR